MIGMVANQVMAAPPVAKITICHKDAGDPDTTISVGGKKEAAKHLSQHPGDHVGACNACGDGFIDDNEACDGTDLAGVTCSDFGYDSGTPVCVSACQDFDISGCFNE